MEGVRPTVRGSVMNPNDHPHGGGEGRAPIGRPSPMSPWGKPTLGKKTRRGKNLLTNLSFVDVRKIILKTYLGVRRKSCTHTIRKGGKWLVVLKRTFRR